MSAECRVHSGVLGRWWLTLKYTKMRDVSIMTKMIQVKFPFTDNSLPEWWYSILVFHDYQIIESGMPPQPIFCHIFDKHGRVINIYDDSLSGVLTDRKYYVDADSHGIGMLKAISGKPNVYHYADMSTCKTMRCYITDKNYFMSDNGNAFGNKSLNQKEVQKIAKSLRAEIDIFDEAFDIIKGKKEKSKLSGHRTRTPQNKCPVKVNFRKML